MGFCKLGRKSQKIGYKAQVLAGSEMPPGKEIGAIARHPAHIDHIIFIRWVNGLEFQFSGIVRSIKRIPGGIDLAVSALSRLFDRIVHQPVLGQRGIEDHDITNLERQIIRHHGSLLGRLRLGWRTKRWVA